MRILCLEKSADARVRLVRTLELAHSENRRTLGHLRLPEILPSSEAELLLGAPYQQQSRAQQKSSAQTQFSAGQRNGGVAEVLVLGNTFSLSEQYQLCRKLSESRADLPIILLLSPENFTLDNLLRFEYLTADIIEVNATSKLLHCLSRILQKQSQSEQTGKVLAVLSAKGGVGATSVATGLAHSAQAFGDSAVIVDLSPQAALSTYLRSPRKYSLELKSLLLDNRLPDAGIVAKATIETPSGISLFLPPPAQTEIRERWLREQSALEITLACLDILKQQFDLLVLDIGNVEGLLPFALCCQADERVLVSSNEAASVFLLNERWQALSQMPLWRKRSRAVNESSSRQAEALLLLNRTEVAGLTREDVQQFLALTTAREDIGESLVELPYDPLAQHWIGSGNSFYTEGGRRTQEALERIYRSLRFNTALEQARPGMFEQLKAKAKNLAELLRPSELLPLKSSQQRLVEPLLEDFSLSGVPESEPNKIALQPNTLTSAVLALEQHSSSDYLDYYQAPLPEGGESAERERGSASLENLLFIAGAAVAALLALPIFFQRFGQYLSSFVDS